jgi:hypothetical protein
MKSPVEQYGNEIDYHTIKAFKKKNLWSTPIAAN